MRPWNFIGKPLKELRRRGRAGIPPAYIFHIRIRRIDHFIEFVTNRHAPDFFAFGITNIRELVCQLVVIGAGMVSAYLAQMALSLDYEITVCDPRTDLLEQFSIAGVKKVADMPDDAVREYAKDASTAIVALTHDPRIDDMGLMEALNTDAYFIGAMGSTRTSANRRDRLKSLDISDEAIARLHAPVGLPIGSKTPAEIAVAILAQLTALRSTADHTVQADFRVAS